jgi:hypothetical protein
LLDVGVRVAQPVHVDGVVDAGEYDAAHLELKAFTDDPTTVVSAARMIKVWGRHQSRARVVEERISD